MAKKRPRRRRWARSRIGSSPGSLEPSPGALATQIRVTGIRPERIDERPATDLSEIDRLREEWPLVWIDIVGLADVDMIAEIGRRFALHELALEDVLSLRQRPKVEEYTDHYFATFRLFTGEAPLEWEQVSLFFGDGFVISCQERPSDCFSAVRRRLQRRGGRLRTRGADYLAYALIDSIVDSFFPLLERFGDRLEDLERDVLAARSPEVLLDVRGVRRDLLILRRGVWPLREAVAALQRGGGSDLISAETRIFLRDCYDHAVQLIDVLETFRELGGSLVDIYLSAASYRSGEVSKVLTVVATIFIPLTFIAGVYGMNFNTTRSPWNMPELDSPWGYPICLGAMLLVAIGMLLFFRHKGWIGRASSRFDEGSDSRHGGAGRG